MHPVNLAEKFALFSDTWSSKPAQPTSFAPRVNVAADHRKLRKP